MIVIYWTHWLALESALRSLLFLILLFFFPPRRVRGGDGRRSATPPHSHGCRAFLPRWVMSNLVFFPLRPGVDVKP